MSSHENPLQNMLLQFQCVRKHFFFNKTYAIQINGSEILIGENLRSPKYRIPICMQTIITISTEPRQEGFIINYHGQPKLFNLQVDKLAEFKNAISSRVLFGEMNQHYKYINELGQGAYSEVRKLVSLDDSKPYAGKLIKKNRLQDALNEIEILSSLNHPNIIKLHEVYDNSSSIVMIQEFFDGITLEQYVQNRCLPIKASDLQGIMRQILLALCYLHEQKVIHRDIKPDNIMIDKQLNLKLIDLGLASRLGKQHIHPKCGTPGYVAPEVINGPCSYDCKSDVYSLGVTFYRLLTLHQIKDDVNLNLLQFLGLADSAVDLLTKMLQQNPKNRISAKDALQHQYFKEIPKLSAKKLQLTQSFTPSVDKLTTEISKINDDKEQDLQDQSNGFGTYSRKQSILVRQISNLQREHQEQQGSRMNSPSSKQPSLLNSPRILPDSYKSLNIIEQQERLTQQLSMKKSLQIGQKKQSRYQTEIGRKKIQQL